MITFFYLVTTILQMITLFTVTKGYPTFALPLLCLVILTGLKDLIDDQRKAKIDSLINNKHTQLLTDEG